MGILFKILLGVNATVAILFLFITQEQKVRESKIEVEKVDMKIETEKFNESFEQSEMEFADTNKTRTYHKEKRDEHKKNVEVIITKRAEAKAKAAELQKKSDDGFAEIEKELDAMDEKDFDF